jgi:dienelactone hydrolase
MPYTHLDIYSNLVEEARRQGPLYPTARPGPQTVQRAREVLGFCDQPEQPQEVQIDACWEKDGLVGEEISWSVGYGPRTRAWFFRPAGVREPLPGVLALHDHGGFKYYGKEKIAEGPGAPSKILQDWFDSAYGGRAWVNALARRGYAVLVHDTFLWGSRKFPVEAMEQALNAESFTTKETGSREEIRHYNTLAGTHEHLVSKYCNLLGTSMAGVVCHEDRIALNYLRSRPEVQVENLACAGLSGGGNRATLLRATADGLKAAIIVGLMSTYEGLLDHNVFSHTWMLFPFGWARYGDWPDLAASCAPLPLLVQYDNEDDLFTLPGMQAAHEKLIAHYQSVGHPQAYTGQFYPGPHKFDIEMQEAAFGWLDTWLKE